MRGSIRSFPMVMLVLALLSRFQRRVHLGSGELSIECLSNKLYKCPVPYLRDRERTMPTKRTSMQKKVIRTRKLKSAARKAVKKKGKAVAKKAAAAKTPQA